MRVIALLVAVSLAACTGGGEPNDAPDAPDVASFEDASVEELAEELHSGFDADNVGALIEAFSRAGISVYDDELTAPLTEIDGEPSALQFMEFQARNMALELSSGSGHLGRQLEALAGSKKSPSISKGLFGYAKEAETFGAELSWSLLDTDFGDQASMVFPTAVLALFLSDAATEGGAEPPEVGSIHDEDIVLAAGPEIRVAAANVCDQLSNFIGATGRAVLGTVIRTLPYVRDVLFGLTLIVTAGSVLRSWTVTVTADPAQTHYGVGEPIEGRFDVQVDSGGSFRWPASVQSCARVVGLELPETKDAPGSQITWTKHAGIPQHLELTGALVDAVDEESTAEMPFTVTEEDSATHEGGGAEVTGAVVVEAKVLRRDALDLLRMVGEIAAPILDFPGAGSAIGSVAELVAELVSPSGYGTVVVKYHELRSAKISWTKGGASFEAHSCDGPKGPWIGALTVAGAGGTDFDFEFPPGGNTTEVSGGFNTIAGPLTFNGTATLVGTHAIRFEITTVAPGAGGTGTAVSDINYGPVSECR